jgi:hypothetical protein
MPWQKLRQWLQAPVASPAVPSDWRIDHETQQFVDAELRRKLPTPSDVQRASFDNDNEFIVVPAILSPALLGRIVAELPRLQAFRSLVPWTRRAGSAGYQDMQAHAPVATAVYRSEVLRTWCEQLANQPMCYKSDDDPHATAMYFYNRTGDWMDYHVDGCGCPDKASYTVIFGIEDRSTQQFLARIKARTIDERLVKVTTTPGTMIFFCGSKLLHGVSRLGCNQVRTVQSIAYTTGETMTRSAQYRESLKDALLYFGTSALRTRRR